MHTDIIIFTSFLCVAWFAHSSLHILYHNINIKPEIIQIIIKFSKVTIILLKTSNNEKFSIWSYTYIHEHRTKYEKESWCNTGKYAKILQNQYYFAFCSTQARHNQKVKLVLYKNVYICVWFCYTFLNYMVILELGKSVVAGHHLQILYNKIIIFLLNAVACL